ncbi:ELL-associated factor 2-like isoform X2 [Mangifera indica]|uniref:ELL-associated factor 2-like isoform X2 n=1 Tax=Mangifera indica TaxID=29780 RepID=UPI001CFBB3E8|nr:ELL-associated factor 2-like isoform X2 [Mangifera indica]
MANNSKEEPKTAPQSDRWYNLTLGSSFKDDSSNKYCTLRYEFKPASIDKTKPGSLHKNKDNRVSVEFHNNQLGKPKVTFEGSSEDYKENDAVLLFDGQTFRLERLHRAVKQLRHLRMPGESASAVSAAVEPRLSPVGKGSKPTHISRNTFPAVPVEVEKIDIGQPENSGAKPAGKGIADQFDQPNLSATSPGSKNDEGDEHQDIDLVDIFGDGSPDDGNTTEQKADVGSDIKVPRHHDTDDEIADVDDSGDEADKGPNAAETLRAQVKGPNAADALRAQVNAAEGDDRSSSSSSSSGSGSSGTGSGSGSSSSSDTEGSDEDSVNSI